MSPGTKDDHFWGLVQYYECRGVQCHTSIGYGVHSLCLHCEYISGIPYDLSQSNVDEMVEKDYYQLFNM
jgi:hypothetical protein